MTVKFRLAFDRPTSGSKYNSWDRVLGLNSFRRKWRKGDGVLSEDAESLRPAARQPRKLTKLDWIPLDRHSRRIGRTLGGVD